MNASTRVPAARVESRLSRVVGQYGTLIILLLTTLFLTWQTKGSFASPGNLINVMEQGAILGAASFAMTMTLIGGGIDMSVAAVAGLCATVLAGLLKDGHPLYVDVIAALVVGAAFGFINGYVIIRVRVKPFVATLCTMFLAIGIKKVYNGGQPIWITTPDLEYLARGRILGVPMPVIWLVVLALILYLLADQSPFGMHLYARGGNPDGARASGVKVNSVARWSYLLAGVLAAIAGVMLAARLSGTPVEVGENLIVDIFTATLISNTLFSDGAPNIAGTLVGALFVSVIQNGSTLMGLGDLYVDALKGVLMLTAGAIGFSRQRKRGEFTQVMF